MVKNYIHYNKLKHDDIRFALGTDRSNKTTIAMMIGANCEDVALITPACVTNWPRVTGDGNYGTLWGPADPMKAKFSLDLTDAPILNDEQNKNFDEMAHLMDAIDDKLLDFVMQNQLRILGRKNLGREELKMLQIRTIRPKYDKITGALIGRALQATTSKYMWDGMGGKTERTINVCDKNGAVVAGGNVAPGDVVAATLYCNQVYTGVGGDKFGIHWSMEDVSVVAQRAKLNVKKDVPKFGEVQYSFASEYEHPVASANPVVSAAAKRDDFFD